MDVSPDMYEMDSKMNRTLNSNNNYTGFYNHGIVPSDRLDISQMSVAGTQSQAIRHNTVRGPSAMKIYQSQKVDRDLIRGNKKTKVSTSSLTFATWNVEDLINEKIVSLQESMIALNIQVLCIQETRRSLSDYWITDKGFLVILSGRSDEKREFAGVGFIIAS